MAETHMEIFYDGECPFCRSYVDMLHLRRSVGPVELVDARSGDPRVAELARQGYSPDTGMIVRQSGHVFHGAEAMTLLNALSDGRSLTIRLLRPLFRRRWSARLVYPLLAAGRGATLRFLGRSKIGL